MEELKPCPFCGGEAVSIVDYDTIVSDKMLMSAYIKCTVCGVAQRVKFDATRKPFTAYTDVFERAVSLWNTRNNQ